MQPLTTTDLDRLVSFPAGKPLHLADVREAMKRLYASGVYASIETETEAAPGGGVNLVFRTTNQWFVGPVEVQGKIALPPNSGQLANAAGLDLGTPFADRDVDSAVKKIRDLLDRNGLYRATVTPNVVRDPLHQQVAITFHIDSHKRARLTLPDIVGDTKLPPDKLAHAAKYKDILFFPWKTATSQTVQAGLQNIRGQYEKKDRLTANVTLERSDYLQEANRVKETIRADGGPVIKIQAEGAKISKGNLKKYVPVFEEDTLNRDLLVRGERNLRDYFQNRGFFEVDVDFSMSDTGPDLKTVTYTISRGEPHRVVSLELRGNRYFGEQVLREHMFLQPKSFIRMRHGRYSESFARRDEDAIEAMYRDNGFRDCKATIVATDDYKGKPGDVGIVVNINEGPQYLVSSLVINGFDRPNKDQVLKNLSSAAGQPFSETTIARDREYIIENLQSAGYPSATFESHNSPGPGPNQVDVVYEITEGQPQFVRGLLISGMHTSRPRLVDPLITLKEGDPLAWTEVGRMQRRLYNLGVFDKVDIAIQNPEGDTQHKFVDLHLVEGNRYTLAVGFGAEIAKIGGAATDVSKSTGSTGFAPRFDLEASRLNLWGLGHSLSFRGRYSTLDRQLSLTYLAPRFHNVEGRNITFTSLYDNTRDVLTFTARRLQGGFQVSQRISKPTQLLFRYTWTDNLVDKSTLKIDPLLIPLYAQTSKVAIFAVNLVQDRRDDPTDAHRGIYNSLDLGLAEHFFGGTRNFGRFLGRNSYYKMVKPDVVFASNTEFGVIKPFHTSNIPSRDYIPLPERFFGGGESTMRGFPMNQAGPRDLTTGFPLGGNALLFHSTELRFPLIGDNISGVVFHDLGNVYSQFSKISFRFHQKDLTDFDYLVHAAGFGVRYKTPLGPLRVDLAYSINPPTFNGLKGTYDQLLFGGAQHVVTSVSHFQFFFSIGQAF